MPILGLDLGASIGWFKAEMVGPVTFGTIAVEGGTDLGRWLNSAMEGLRPLIRGCDGIAVEQPFMSDSWWVTRKLVSGLGLVHLLANSYGISSGRIAEIPVATAKLTLAGSGKADKDMMIAAAHERGWFVEDQHQADAAAMWQVYMHGRREPAAKAKTRSSKGVSLMKGGAGG